LLFYEQVVQQKANQFIDKGLNEYQESTWRKITHWAFRGKTALLPESTSIFCQMQMRYG